MESHLAEVYQVLHPYLDPKAKSLLRLVSKAVRVAVDEYVDTLHVRQCQLRQLGESAFQPTCLTIHLSYEAPQSWAGLQLAFVLRNLKTLIMMAGKLSSQLCQALRGCLRKITRLELHGVQVDDPDTLWSNAINLRHITMVNSPLSSETINRLLYLTELKGLELSSPYSGLRDKPLAKIQDLICLNQLETLELEGTGVVQGNAADLTSVRQVTRFAWREGNDGSPWTDKAWIDRYRPALPLWLAAWPGLVHLDVGIELTRPLLEEILRALPQLQYLGCPQLTLDLEPGEPRVVMPHVRTLCIRPSARLHVDTLVAFEAPRLENFEGGDRINLVMNPRREDHLQHLASVAGGLLRHKSYIRFPPPPPHMPPPPPGLAGAALLGSFPAAAVEAVFTALAAWDPLPTTKWPATIDMPYGSVNRAALAALPRAVAVLRFDRHTSISRDALQALATKTSLTSLDLSSVQYIRHNTSIKAQVISLAQAAPQGSRLCIKVPSGMFRVPELAAARQNIAEHRQQAGLMTGVPQLVQQEDGARVPQQPLMPEEEDGEFDDEELDAAMAALGDEEEEEAAPAAENVEVVVIDEDD